MDTDKIVEMLSRGYSQTVVASAVGCTDSYISQLLSDETLREQISARRLQYLEKQVTADDSIDEVEDLALQKVKKLLPFLTNPMQALRIYQVANAAKRKTVAPETATESKGVSVTINLPEVAAVQFKLSTDKQVVEVDGRSMTTMPSNVLNQRLVAKRALPQLSDQVSAQNLLNNIEAGLAHMEVPNLVHS